MEWIRGRFPEARWWAPAERYGRIHHPVRTGAAEDLRLDALPAGALFFDLETLGFLGHPIFLVGCLRREEKGGWEVVQFLARDYTEEEAILQAFLEESRDLARWVSFNGKAFDLPHLRSRAAFYGMTAPKPPEHIDLLPLARRVYRRVLPDCRLQTLESRIFGRYRFRDVSGFEIPAAYHAFVRGADPEVMGRILLHNRNDLVTLVRLLVHLDAGEAAG